MKAIFFEAHETIKSANEWLAKHQGLIEVVRKEVGQYGLTVWYKPKFNEVKA